MADTSTKKAQLKRVFALKRGDRARSLRLYTREGKLLTGRVDNSIAAARIGEWTVISPAELDDSGYLIVAMQCGSSDVRLFSPADAYMVLAD